MCRSRLFRNFPSARLGRQPICRLLALASLVAAGCGGEQAIRARDGGAAGVAGATAGSAGRGGNAGRGGGAGTGVAGLGGSVAGGAGGSAGGGDAGAGGGGTSGTSGTGGAGAIAGAGGRGGGAGGRGGGAGGGGTGGRATGPGTNGSTCTSGDQCMSGWCVDGVCCFNSCTGTCMRCNAPTGNCQPIADLTDPDNECTMEDTSTCGNTGDCNGAGACRKYGNNTVCDSTPSCSGGSLVMTKVCNGTGGPTSCVPNGTKSCDGFLCSGSPAACGTSCGDDTACAAGAYCAAATCVATPNIAGNGDLEYGALTGWTAASGTSTIAMTTAVGTVHGGQNAIVDSVRMAYYQGPGYALPTGLGAYKVTAWAFQKDPNWAMLTGALTVAVKCKDTTITAYFINFAQVTIPQNSWEMLSGTIDINTQTPASDCNPASGGLVRSVLLYLNQTEQGCTTGTCPDLYMDDLVVNVTDGHNLVGNYNFEAGFTDGWGVSSGSAVQAAVTTFAHGGTHSLRQYNRQTPATGPRYLLPTGYGRYNVSFWVMQNGTVAHDLILQSTYTCAQGGGAQTPPATRTVAGVMPGIWTQVSGTVTMPPANAMPGCRMTAPAVYVMQEGSACGSGSGQVECADLYVDDASITMATTP